MPAVAANAPTSNHATMDGFRRDAADGISAEEAVRASVRVVGAESFSLCDRVVATEQDRGKRVRFSELCLREMASLPDHHEEFARRPAVPGVKLTIDSYDSQDLDDGLSFHREADGTRVAQMSLERSVHAREN